MSHLVLLLLGVDYLHKRARALMIGGWLMLAAGAFVFLDALDNALYFPLNFFAALLVAEGIATLAIAKSGVGGQRVLRYTKGCSCWWPAHWCWRAIITGISCCR